MIDEEKIGEGPEEAHSVQEKVRSVETMPRIPRGAVSRISRLMKLWHENPERAAGFIDPKHAEAMWGASKARPVADVKMSDSDDVLRELWIRSPERAMRYISPLDALFKFGCPPSMTRTRFVHLKMLYARLHEKDGE